MGINRSGVCQCGESKPVEWAQCDDCRNASIRRNKSGNGWSRCKKCGETTNAQFISAGNVCRTCSRRRLSENARLRHAGVAVE